MCFFKFTTFATCTVIDNHHNWLSFINTYNICRENMSFSFKKDCRGIIYIHKVRYGEEDMSGQECLSHCDVV